MSPALIESDRKRFWVVHLPFLIPIRFYLFFRQPATSDSIFHSARSKCCSRPNLLYLFRRARPIYQQLDYCPSTNPRWFLRSDATKTSHFAFLERTFRAIKWLCRHSIEKNRLSSCVEKSLRILLSNKPESFENPLPRFTHRLSAQSALIPEK